MNFDVHRKLKELASAQDTEYGKLIQKLLAIAFCEAGAARVTDRSVQGIDLEIILRDGRGLALEVKTSQAGKVRFGKKDIDGLAARADEGLLPYFALLGPRLTDEWIFAQCMPAEIRPQRDYPLTQLRAYRDINLEEIIRDTFPAAVISHTASAISGGQGALNKILEGYSCYAVA